MPRKLHTITVQPNEPTFWWQTAVQCHNFRKFGLTEKMTVIVFYNEETDDFSQWGKLKTAFPEVNFVFIGDNGGVTRDIKIVDYPSLVRPFCLEKFFTTSGEDDAYFYIDADVLLTKPLQVDNLLDDHTNYLSYTGRREIGYNYTCYDHFLDKEKNIREDRMDYYRQVDPLAKLLEYFSLTRKDLEERKDNTGGVQYILKNLTPKFWSDVYEACTVIRQHLQRVNQHFMIGETRQEREDNGFQSWCADLHAIQWLLWRDKKESKCPEVLDFTWASDPINEWNIHSIYHDAGSTPEGKLFHKRGRYIEENGDPKALMSYTLRWGHPKLRTPFIDDLSYVDQNFCSINYVKEITETKQYLNL